MGARLEEGWDYTGRIALLFIRYASATTHVRFGPEADVAPGAEPTAVGPTSRFLKLNSTPCRCCTPAP